MPWLPRPCGASIRYSVKGSGVPLLLLAPGGMRSCLPNWASQPIDPWSSLPLDRFQLIAIDQRSAMPAVSPGASHASIERGDGWHTFRDDQLALLDHLGLARCHLLGSCIGPSFALRLLRDAPSRFGAAVLMQPIGLARHTSEPGHAWQGLNTAATSHWFGGWAKEMIRHSLATDEALQELHASMFGGRDFVFSVTREEVKQVQAPLLVLMGCDIYHPSEISREISRLAPHAELIEEWRNSGPSAVEAATKRIEEFLLHNHARSYCMNEL
ncbi:hypothetical protein AB1Y20_005505 [Prymnesium parvum]|uniref:AB hydrolase-1 domain-containing protein n=1 Tax=Prymnesium parvum TaxID=97485 RepID=A0AB34J6H1_PRYPA